MSDTTFDYIIIGAVRQPTSLPIRASGCLIDRL